MTKSQCFRRKSVKNNFWGGFLSPCSPCHLNHADLPPWHLSSGKLLSCLSVEEKPSRILSWSGLERGTPLQRWKIFGGKVRRGEVKHSSSSGHNYVWNKTTINYLFPQCCNCNSTLSTSMMIHSWSFKTFYLCGNRKDNSLKKSFYLQDRLVVYTQIDFK